MPNGKPNKQQVSGTGASGKTERIDAGARAELKQLRNQIKSMRVQRVDGSNVAHNVLYEQFKAALGAITDPFNSAPQRFSFAGGRPTAVNRLFRIDSNGSASSTSSGTVLAANCGFMAVRRDPRCASVRYHAQAGSSTYLAQFETGGSITSAAPGPAAGEYFSPVRYDFVAGTWERHGPQFCPWQDLEGTNRFWLDVEPAGGVTANINITGLAASTSYTMVLSRELLGVITEYRVTANSDAGGVWTYTPPNGTSGRWAVQAITDLSALTVAMNFQTSCPSSFCHRMLPKLENQLDDIDALRVNALSLLYSDRTAELTSQGSIVTAQVSASDDWAEHAGLTNTIGNSVNNYSTVAEYNIAKNGKYKKGRYNFCKLAGIEDLKMVDVSDGPVGSRYLPAIRYMDTDETHDYLIMLFDGSNATSLNGQFTACWHTEGETESQWRDVEAPVMHPDVFKDAQWVSAQASQDYENPSHLKAIWSFVKKSASILSSVGGAVAPFIPHPGIRGGVAAAAGIAGAVSTLPF